MISGIVVIKQQEKEAYGNANNQQLVEENIDNKEERIGDNYEDVNNVTDLTSDIDTSNWKTYQNDDLGFEFMYPSECTLVHDPGGVIGVGECYEEKILLLFYDIDLQDKIDSNLDIEEVVQIYNLATKNHNIASMPTDRYVSDVKKVNLSEQLVGYKFSFDFAYCSNIGSDYSCEGGGLVDDTTSYVFLLSNDKRIKLMFPEKSVYSQFILSTIHKLN